MADLFVVDGKSYTRDKALTLIYRHSHTDSKGRIDGKRTILVNRGGEGTCLVELTALTDAEITADLPYAVAREKERLQRGQPDDPETSRLHELLNQARANGDITPNGVAYNWWLANADGAGYELLREPQHSDEDIDAAKRHLRADHDVVSLRVTTVPPLNGSKA